MADTSAFVGFANAPADEDGNVVDFRDVPAYEDTSDAGKVRDASQTTKSSIVAFKTEGKGTNGAPAAIVPAPEAESDPEDDTSDADAAGGEEDSDSSDDSTGEPVSTES